MTTTPQSLLTPGSLVACCRARAKLWQSGANPLGNRFGKFPVGTVVMFVRYAGCTPEQKANPPISIVHSDGTLWYAATESLKAYSGQTTHAETNPWQDLPGPPDTER